MLLSCYLDNYEYFGLFIGCYLGVSEYRDLRRYKNSVEFYNKVSVELEKFLDAHEYTQQNIEKWFGRLVSLAGLLFL